MDMYEWKLGKTLIALPVQGYMPKLDQRPQNLPQKSNVQPVRLTQAPLRDPVQKVPPVAVVERSSGTQSSVQKLSVVYKARPVFQGKGAKVVKKVNELPFVNILHDRFVRSKK